MSFTFKSHEGVILSLIEVRIVEVDFQKASSVAN